MALSDSDLEAFRKVIEERQNKRKASRPVQKKVRKDYSVEEYKKRMDAENRRTAEMVKDQTAKRVNHSLERWKEIVGPRFFGAGIDINEPKIMERIANFKKGTGRYNSSVVLTGGLGVGKTWRAYGYAEKLIRENILQQANIVAGTEISVLGSIASSGFRKADKMAELMDPKHKLFLIDEVGRTRFPNMEAQHEIWYELINYIYMNDLTLVISTNKSTKEHKKQIYVEQPTFKSVAERNKWNAEHSPEENFLMTTELEEWIGKAAYDRLKHIVGDGIIIPDGPNRRPELLAEKKRRQE